MLILTNLRETIRAKNLLTVLVSGGRDLRPGHDELFRVKLKFGLWNNERLVFTYWAWKKAIGVSVSTRIRSSGRLQNWQSD